MIITNTTGEHQIVETVTFNNESYVIVRTNYRQIVGYVAENNLTAGTWAFTIGPIDAGNPGQAQPLALTSVRPNTFSMPSLVIIPSEYSKVATNTGASISGTFHFFLG